MNKRARLHPTTLVLASGLAALTPAAIAGAQSATAPSRNDPMADAGIPVTLVLSGLVRREVRLISAGDAGVVYADETGRRREAPSGTVLAVIRRTADAPSGGTRTYRVGRRAMRIAGNDGVLRLTDGQRFPGRPVTIGEDDHPETIGWWHTVLATVHHPLDRVAGFSTPQSDPIDARLTDPVPATDIVVLRNADRLSGFFSVSADAARIETDSGVVDVPMDLVASVVLANPREPASGGRVWFSDGSIVAIAGLSYTESGRLSFALPDGRSITRLWADVESVAFDAGRLAALSSLDVASVDGVGGRRFVPGVEPAESDQEAPALNARDLLLPGPMEVRWSLPEGATRVGGVVALSGDALPWGDCEVVIDAGAGEVLRQRLHAERTAVAFSLAANPGAGLTVRVEPGRYGPINDRVTLRAALVELAPSPAPR